MAQRESLKDFKVKLPSAVGVYDACLQNRDLAKTNGTMIAVYCKHNAAGAAMLIMADGQPSRFWQIYSPISIQEFSNAVVAAVEMAKAQELDKRKKIN